MNRPTVQSIADQLGLSKFAVSRALSGKSGVSEETRRAVVELAERLGYQTRPFVRRNGTQHVLALITDEATAGRELWLNVRLGIELQAMRDALTVEFQVCSDSTALQRMAEGARALILLGPGRPELYRAAQATGLPVVAVTQRIPALLDIDQVTTNDEETGVCVGELLLGLGHRDIVYVHGKAGFSGRDARLRGLRDALGREKSARVGEITFAEDYSATDMVPTLRRLLADGLQPTAFFCGSDGVAVTVLSELRRLGLSVPGDCTVVGHADYPLATQVTPTLTTIRMPHREVGMQALRVLSSRLGEREPITVGPALRLLLNAALIERESSGPPGQPAWTRALGLADARTVA